MAVLYGLLYIDMDAATADLTVMDVRCRLAVSLHHRNRANRLLLRQPALPAASREIDKNIPTLADHNPRHHRPLLLLRNIRVFLLSADAGAASL